MRILTLLAILLTPLLAQQDPRAYVPNLTPTNRVDPVLPAEVRSQGMGIVRLLITIDSRGVVTDVEALTGPDHLRKPAMDAVQQWQFRPVMRDGQPVAASTDTLVTFFTPGAAPRLQTDLQQEVAVFERLRGLQNRFPRSQELVLQDLEQDTGANGPERSYALPRLAKAAWEAGAMDKAEAYARELLSRAQAEKDWNRGNAIHDGNVVLGLAAIARGDIAQAEWHLIEAGKTPGSPQLDSFGPNMLLARQLIEKGRRDVVLQYFEECRAFWKMGGEQLDNWSATVRGGGMPDFRANLKY